MKKADMRRKLLLWLAICSALVFCITFLDVREPQYDLAPDQKADIVFQKRNQSDATRIRIQNTAPDFEVRIWPKSGKARISLFARRHLNSFNDAPYITKVFCDTASIKYEEKIYFPRNVKPAETERDETGFCDGRNHTIIGIPENRASIVPSIVHIEFELPARMSGPAYVTLPFVRDELPDLQYMQFMQVQFPNRTFTYEIRKFFEGGGWH